MIVSTTVSLSKTPAGEHMSSVRIAWDLARPVAGALLYDVTVFIKTARSIHTHAPSPAFRGPHLEIRSYTIQL